MSIRDLFCSVDEFWQRFEPLWQRELLAAGRRRRRRGRMSPSELMTIVMLFQQSQYRTFKAFYTKQVQQYRRDEFPRLVSYNRFVELMPSVLVPSVLVPLAVYLHEHFGDCTGVSFIDSTALAVCHHARIGQHRVFACDAARGKTSVGWFYGCKLHPVVDDRGELLAFCLTRGNVAATSRQRRRSPSRPAPGATPLRQALRRPGLHLPGPRRAVVRAPGAASHHQAA